MARSDLGPGRRGNWAMFLLPHLEQTSLFNRFDKTDLYKNQQGGTNAANAQPWSGFFCPSDLVPPAVKWGANYYATGSYHVNGGRISWWYSKPSQGMFMYNKPVRLAEVTDGVSQTLLAGEFSHIDPIFDEIDAGEGDLIYWTWIYTYWSVCFSYAPLNYRVPPEAINYPPHSAAWKGVFYTRADSFGSQHPGGVNFIMADGSGRFLKDTIPQLSYIYMSTRGDNDVVGNDW